MFPVLSVTLVAVLNALQMALNMYFPKFIFSFTEHLCNISQDCLDIVCECLCVFVFYYEPLNAYYCV